MKKTVGIIFADEMEYIPFLNAVKPMGAVEDVSFGNQTVSLTMKKEWGSLDIIAVRCGIGKVNAAGACAFLIAHNGADFILNAGLSGAVQGLRREDIIAADSFVECDYDLTAIGYPLGKKPDGQTYLYKANEKLLSLALTLDGVKKASTGSGDIFLTDKVKKELYRDTFGVQSFDMETAAIASVCDKCDIPFASLRKISDDADDSSAEAYTEMNERKEICLTELLLALCKKILADSELMS